VRVPPMHARVGPKVTKLCRARVARVRTSQRRVCAQKSAPLVLTIPVSCPSLYLPADVAPADGREDVPLAACVMKCEIRRDVLASVVHEPLLCIAPGGLPSPCRA